MDKTFRLTFLILVVLSLAACSGMEEAGSYSSKSPSRDGTGKVYMGREISHVMGHLGAGWLERSEREQEERTDLLIDNLPLQKDFVVADIGAGTGYFTFPIAKRVPNGKVLAVDIEQKMLDIVTTRIKQNGVDNVETVLGEIDDPNLKPSSVDLVLMVDAYHEFSHPLEMGRVIANALTPGGYVVLIEYRGEDKQVPIKPLHKMTANQAILEMAALGLTWQRTENFLPTQHFMVFRKSEGK
ncbi:MAG: class I SAM-dependent methyltransferase [Gammaproteobacteria bacterium]